MGKTALINAKVYISEGKFAQALLCEDGIISAVGSNDEILDKCGTAEITDCGGRTVLPGFNDSHLHFLETALLRVKADIAPARSADELVEICRRYIAENPELVKNGMAAGGWNQENFTGAGRMPERRDLDRISCDIPIFLERVCGHIAAANTPLLKMLGLPDNHNGLLYGNDCNLAKNLIPRYDDSLVRGLILREMQSAARCGLTSVQSNDAGTSTNSYTETFRLIRGIYEDGLAPVRYRHQVCFNSIPEFEEYLGSSEMQSLAACGDMLTRGPLKLFRDGSFGAGTALMQEPYPGSGSNGLEWTDSESFDTYVRLAEKAGLQVVTHAIGDLAVKRTAESYARHMKKGNPNRHAIVHCSVTPPDIIKLIADNKIGVMGQPVFINSDISMIENKLPEAAGRSCYKYAELMRLGVPFAMGTDCPVESYNPFLNIYYAMGGRDAAGKICPDYKPMSVYEAVDAYTAGSAYLEFAEERKGRLLPGFMADFTVLDRDIFSCPTDEIKEILPVMTVTAGRAVFRDRI